LREVSLLCPDPHHFEDPIVLPNDAQLLTLRDATNLSPTKADHTASEWQAAMEGAELPQLAIKYR
jgi:hypothetical protein